MAYSDHLFLAISNFSDAFGWRNTALYTTHIDGEAATYNVSLATLCGGISDRKTSDCQDNSSYQH
jgi:hypothetical protein